MEELRCPFCWGENIIPINNVNANDSNRTRDLMECIECERFYWEETGAEVINLSEICKTISSEPRKCYQDVKDPHRSGFLTYPKQKIKELNQLCSTCPNRQFIMKKEENYLNPEPELRFS